MEEIGRGRERERELERECGCGAGAQRHYEICHIFVVAFCYTVKASFHILLDDRIAVMG